jgi:hypothetical protein
MESNGFIPERMRVPVTSSFLFITRYIVSIYQIQLGRVEYKLSMSVDLH